MWGDTTGDFILIGDEDCKPGDPLIAVRCVPDEILSWIRALAKMVEDGDIENVPGEIVKCTKAE